MVLAGAVGLALLLAATGRYDAAEFPFGELPLHLLLVQNWGFTDALAWNDPAWSISAELGAYLLFPLLALAIDWRRVPSWAVIAAITAAAVVLASVFAWADAPTLGHDITRLGLIRCVIEFGMGTADRCAVATLARRARGTGPSSRRRSRRRCSSRRCQRRCAFRARSPACCSHWR